MRTVRAIGALLISYLFATSAFSWSETGHIVIAELAASKLGTERHELNRIAGTLATQIESEKRLYLIRNYTDISYLGQVASFPDSVRNQTVSELFAKYGDSVPISLTKYSDQNTSNWHYINQPFISSDYRQDCNIIDPVNITTVIPELISAYGEEESEKNKGIILAFIIHLVADSSQPMHTFTKVFYDCEHDRGGTEFCASDRAGDRRCETTLHELWDRAVGYFDETKSLQQRVNQIDAVQVNSVVAAQTDPREWVASGPRQARFIYSVSINKDPDSIYIQQGQQRAEQSLAEGAAWLTNVLKALN